MKSSIGELINATVPYVLETATVREALYLIEDNGVDCIIILNSAEEVIGLVEDVTLEELNDELTLSQVSIDIRFKGVHKQLHVYDALKIMKDNAWTVLPVVGDDWVYVGGVKLEDLTNELVENLAYKYSGAIIVLRTLETDYSLSEIIRICESNDTRVLSVGTQKEEDSRAVYIILKLEKKDISSVIASLNRYEYEVIASYGHNLYNEDLKGRLDLLMHFINM